VLKDSGRGQKLAEHWPCYFVLKIYNIDPPPPLPITFKYNKWKFFWMILWSTCMVLDEFSFIVWQRTFDQMLVGISIVRANTSTSTINILRNGLEILKGLSGQDRPESAPLDICFFDLSFECCLVSKFLSSSIQKNVGMSGRTTD
jgi:hypothetical protein